MGLFVLGHPKVYKELVKVGERDLMSDGSDAEMAYIQKAPG